MKRVFILFFLAAGAALVLSWPELKKKPLVVNSFKKIELDKKLAEVKKIDFKKFSNFYKDIKISFFDYLGDVKKTNEKEVLTFQLMKRNRELRLEVQRMKSRLTALRLQNEFLISEKKPLRFPAAVDKNNDLVQFSSYKWKDKKLLRIGKREWNRKNYVKSAQYFYSLIHYYPKSPLIDDLVLFQTAMAAWESEIYSSWVHHSLNKLIQEYPSSRYYRGAKLWRALNLYEGGEKEELYKTLEEFKLKYRNTPEWRILSRYYEKLQKNIYL